MFVLPFRLLLLASLTPALCLAGDSASTRSPLTPLSLQEAIAMALENNLTLEIESIDVDVEGERVKEAQGEFEPTLNMRAIYESIRNPQNQQEFAATQSSIADADFSQNNLFQEENVRLEGSVDGKLPLGTQWSLVAESDRLANTLNIEMPPSLFYPEYDTFLGVRITQPLLRDFGKKAQLAQVRLAAADKELANLDWNRNVQEVVADIAKNYYDLLFAIGDERIKIESIGLARELVSGNKKRLDEGFGSPVEVRQAEVAVSVRQEERIAAQHFIREQQNRLIRQLFRDFDILNPPKLVPTGNLRLSLPTIDKSNLLATALENRAEYQANLEQVRKQDIQIQFTENQLLPRVDLVGTLGGNGLEGNFGPAIDDAASREGLQWSAGVVVSVPLGNRSERARIAAEKMRKTQLVLNLKQIEVDIALQIDTAVSRIESTLQRLKTANQSAELAEQTLAEEGERLTQGVTNSFQILAAQEDVATAHTRELAAQADLSKSVIDLWLASGILLQEMGVAVEPKSGPPATLAK